MRNLYWLVCLMMAVTRVNAQCPVVDQQSIDGSGIQWSAAPGKRIVGGGVSWQAPSGISDYNVHYFDATTGLEFKSIAHFSDTYLPLYDEQRKYYVAIQSRCGDGSESGFVIITDVIPI
jgi:hypothetical protein